MYDYTPYSESILRWYEGSKVKVGNVKIKYGDNMELYILSNAMYA